MQVPSEEKDFTPWLNGLKETLFYQQLEEAGSDTSSVVSDVQNLIESLFACLYGDSYNVKIKNAIINLLKELVLKGYYGEFWWSHFHGQALFSVKSAMEQIPVPYTYLRQWLSFFQDTASILCSKLREIKDESFDNFKNCINSLAASAFEPNEKFSYQWKGQVMKFLQTLIITLCEDEGDSNLKEFGHSLLERFLQLARVQKVTNSQITGALSLLPLILRERPESLGPMVISALLELVDHPPTHLSSNQSKCLAHALKIQLQVLSRMKEIPKTYSLLIQETLATSSLLISSSNNNSNIGSYSTEKSVAGGKKRDSNALLEVDSLDDNGRGKRVKSQESTPLKAKKMTETELREEAIRECVPRKLNPTRLPLEPMIDLIEKVLTGTSIQELETSLIKWNTALVNRKAAQSSTGDDPRRRDPRKKPDSQVASNAASGFASYSKNSNLSLNLLYSAFGIAPVEEEPVKKESSSSSAIVTRNFEEKFVLPEPSIPSTLECFEMIMMSFQRVFDQEHPMTLTYKARSLWTTSLLRMFQSILFTFPGKASLFKACQLFCDYILQDLRTRSDLALLWLNLLYASDALKQTDSKLGNPFPLYDEWCLALIKGIPKSLDPKDKTIVKLILDLPRFPTKACLSLIHSYASGTESHQFQIALITLRDLIVQRPILRNECVRFFCQLCFSRDNGKRTAAVIMVKKWLLDIEPVVDQIEAFVMERVDRMLGCMEKAYTAFYEQKKKKSRVIQLVKQFIHSELDFKLIVPDFKQFGFIKEGSNDEDEEDDEMDEDEKSIEEGEAISPTQMNESFNIEYEKSSSFQVIDKLVGWDEGSYTRYTELLVVLCMKKPKHLLRLFEIYARVSDEEIRNCIKNQMSFVVRSMSVDSPEWEYLLRNFPIGADMAVLRMLILLTNNNSASNPAVGVKFKEILVQVVKERGLDITFLVPIVQQMSKEEAINNYSLLFGGLLEGDGEGEKEIRIAREIIQRLVDPRVSSSNTSGSGAISGTNAPPPGATSNANNPTASTSNNASATNATTMSPAEFLVSVHQFGGGVSDFNSLTSDAEGKSILDKSRKEHLKLAILIINQALSMPKYFTQEAIAIALQQLADLPDYPILFMRTLIQVANSLVQLRGYIVTILNRLVNRAKGGSGWGASNKRRGVCIWDNDQLWKGFAVCCEILLPGSIPILLSLPVDKFESITSLMDPKKLVELKLRLKSFPTFSQTMTLNTNTAHDQRAMILRYLQIVDSRLPKA